MPELVELDRFLKWIEQHDEEVMREFDLDVQLNSYIQTYPGRTLDLLSELAQAAIDQREEQ